MTKQQITIKIQLKIFWYKMSEEQETFPKFLLPEIYVGPCNSFEGYLKKEKLTSQLDFSIVLPEFIDFEQKKEK
jgi:hypothetical protein